MNEVDQIKKYLEEGGAVVKSGDELPDDIRAEIDERARNAPWDKIGIDIAALDESQVYYYEDSYLRITIPVCDVDVFMAFMGEMSRIGPDMKDARQYLIILARALWYLYVRPKKIRRLKDGDALKLLKEVVPKADVAATSLREALDGFLAFVFGKKKRARAPDSAA